MSEAPEIFGEPTPLPDEPAPEPIVAAEDGVQLSLAAAAAAAAEKGEAGEADVALAFADAERRQWSLPDPAVLRRLAQGNGEAPDAVARVSERLVSTLASFNIPAQVIGTVSGPRVTRYELQLAPGIKVNKVANLKDDLAYALAATDVRVQAPIPGKQAVGVEVPNIQANYVSLGDVHGLFPQHASPMAFWLGKDVTGKAVLADLVRMVHLLIAGTTGSGKSGCLNALITSILLRATPDEVRMIMIDPKKVELSNFNGVPHLLAPVVTNMKQATYVLDNICREMDRRYDVLSRNGCQDIRALNKKLVRAGRGRHAVHDGDHRRAGRPHDGGPVGGRGLHHPPRPARAQLRHPPRGRHPAPVGRRGHRHDQDQHPVADRLRRRFADGLAHHPRPGRRREPARDGRHAVLPHGQQQAHARAGRPDHQRRDEAHHRALAPAVEAGLPRGAPREPGRPGRRAVGAVGRRRRTTSAEAIKTVVNTGAASVALLQRRLRVGYARAGRLIDIMEEMGIISGYDGSKARSVLIDEAGLPTALARLNGDVIEPAPLPDEPPPTRRSAGGAAFGGRAGALRPVASRPLVPARLSSPHPVTRLYVRVTAAT